MSTHHVGCSAGAGGVGSTQLWDHTGLGQLAGSAPQRLLNLSGPVFSLTMGGKPVLHVDVKTEGNYVQQESAGTTLHFKTSRMWKVGADKQACGQRLLNTPSLSSMDTYFTVFAFLRAYF